jgi:hypothetical protein
MCVWSVTGVSVEQCLSQQNQTLESREEAARTAWCQDGKALESPESKRQR